MNSDLLSRTESDSQASSLKVVGSHIDLDSAYLSVDTSSFEVGSLLRAAAQYDATRTEVAKSVLLERFYRAAASVQDDKDVRNLQRIIDDMIKQGGAMETLGPELKEAISLENKALNELLGRTYERSYKNNYKSYTVQRDGPVSFPKMDDKGNIDGFDTQYNITYPYVPEEKEYMENAVKELFDYIVEFDATRTPESEAKVNEYFIKAALKAQDQEDIDYIYGTIGQLDKQGGVAYLVLSRNESILSLDEIKKYREDLGDTALSQEEKEEKDKAHYEEFETNYNDATKAYERFKNKEDISAEELEEIHNIIEAAQGSLEGLIDFYTDEEYEDYKEELADMERDVLVQLELAQAGVRVR